MPKDARALRRVVTHDEKCRARFVLHRRGQRFKVRGRRCGRIVGRQIRTRHSEPKTEQPPTVSCRVKQDLREPPTSSSPHPPDRPRPPPTEMSPAGCPVRVPSPIYASEAAQLLITLLAPLKDIDSSSSPCTTRSRSGHEQAILGHISMQQDCNSCSESVACSSHVWLVLRLSGLRAHSLGRACHALCVDCDQIDVSCFTRHGRRWFHGRKEGSRPGREIKTPSPVFPQ